MLVDRKGFGRQNTLRRLDGQLEMQTWVREVGGLCLYIKSFISVISPSCHSISKQSSRVDTVYYSSVSDIYLPTIYGHTLSHFDCTIAWKWIYFYLQFTDTRAENFKKPIRIR